ncbi:MAG: hypothetical protein ACK42D_02650 [Candidatus Paceibacteria bacterium]
MLKQIFIPVAAFAITAVGASAFTGVGTDWIKNSDLSLSDSQISALDEAREIRSAAQVQAKKVLESAGIDQEKILEIHKVMNESHKQNHEAVNEAVTNNDYNAFMLAVEGTLIAEKITSEADFTKYVEAQALIKSGDKDGAKTILQDLGITGPKGSMMGKSRGMREGFSGPDQERGSNGRQSAES